MFLTCSTRRKDGKGHRSWSIVESRRYSGGKVAQHHVPCLGEINDSQRRAWERTIEVFDERAGDQRQIALFPSDLTPPPGATDTVQVRLDALRLERPRQWGACWMGDELWRMLELDQFFARRLGVRRGRRLWDTGIRPNGGT